MLSIALLPLSAPVTPEVSVWHVILTFGQSNSVGTNSQQGGYPVWPTTPRIQNYCFSGLLECTAREFSPAKVPLYGETNVGFSQTFANLLLPTLPEDHGIVLLNTGVGGTGFQDGKWVVPDGPLLQRSLTAVEELSDALPKNLGGNYSFHAMLWHQGEDDAGDNNRGFAASYCTYLESDLSALIDYARTHMPGASKSTPFLTGGMLPYWVDTANGTEGVMSAIYAVNTSRTFTGTADSRIFPDFFPGTHTPDGEPNYRSGASGLVIHFNATEATLLGHQYWAAYHRAVELETVVPSQRTLQCNKSAAPVVEAS
tara:strand:- start:3776 stop:4714 length:939 start_codon:yes stop_codon:yes gene_type:complete